MKIKNKNILDNKLLILKKRSKKLKKNYLKLID